VKGVAALLACLIPAWRAAKIDPARAPRLSANKKAHDPVG